jgi:pseudouridine kinase
MMAGLVWAFLRGLELRESGLAGLAASAIAVESAQTVSPAMSEEALVQRMGLTHQNR